MLSSSSSKKQLKHLKQTPGICPGVQESFLCLRSIERTVVEPWEVVESALEAANPVWEPQFAGSLTEAEIGLRNAVEGQASRSIFQSQVSRIVAKKTV